MGRNTSGLKRGGPGRKSGIPNKATVAIKEASRLLLEDPAYVAKLRIRLIEGHAGPVESLLYHYAYGKPKETIAVEGDVPPFILRIQADDGE